MTSKVGGSNNKQIVSKQQSAKLEHQSAKFKQQSGKHET
jgi:hypothetical protein